MGGLALPGARPDGPWQWFRLHATSVEVVGFPSYEVWAEAFAELSRAQGSLQWWIGDMLAVGESRYGQKYAQAVEATGYSVQTLMNAVSVAGRIAPERRRASLSFTHHKEVAALEPDEQEALLAEAESRRWSSREMAEAVRTYKRALKPAAPEAEESKPANLPARVDLPPTPEPESAATAPTPALTLDEWVEAEAAATGPEDDGRDASRGDILAELEEADKEIRELQTLVASLQADDKGREIARLALMYNQLEGRLRQEMATANEAKKQAKAQGEILKKIRGMLRVQSNGEILSRLMELGV